MRQYLSAAGTALILATLAGAQPVSRKEPVPYAGSVRASRVEARPPGVRLGLRSPREFALTPLSDLEVAKLAESGPRLKLGVHRPVPAGTLAAGSWEMTSEGTRVWRLSLRSPGSTGIRIEFRNFSIGAGKVWIHDGVNIAGPYAGKGPFGDGRFWSPTIDADRLVVEYEAAPEAAAESVPPFEIRTVSHRQRISRMRPASAILVPQAGTPDPADYCELDARCYPEWQDTISTVGQLMFEDADGAYLCSGSLLATRNNSFKPYLLTAGHCIHSEETARSLEVFWNYQTNTCGGTPPATRTASTLKSTQGAHLIGATSLSDGDYSLVLLNEIPSGVTFAGWDVRDPAPGTLLTGIHHPSGSWKRISFGERVRDESNEVGLDFAPGSRYLQVLWERGRIEHGSSGSPLFSSPGVIVGAASYGPFSPMLSVCEITPNVAGYSRFSDTYNSFRDYLEDLPAAMVLPERPDVSFAVRNRVTPAGQTVNLKTQSAGTVTYKLRADAPWIRLSAVTGTISSKTPATVTLSVDATQFDRPDRYVGTVTILSGAAAPQFINVVADVRTEHSNVVPAITPNPVILAGGQWKFQIRLSETAGMATRLTGIKINGVDYSPAISSWFGTSQIPANGNITAPLETSGLFPRGTWYFEFHGTDVADGHLWYAAVPAIFQ